MKKCLTSHVIRLFVFKAIIQIKILFKIRMNGDQ